MIKFIFFRFFYICVIAILISFFQVSFIESCFAQAPNATLYGRILTSDQTPADNVSVYLSNTDITTVTDEKGNFQIKAQPGTYTLMIKHIGLLSTQITVRINPGENTLETIMLTITNHQLQEVSISGGRINKFGRKSSEYVSRLPLNNLENPQVYSSISKELLKDQQVNNLDEALKNAAGVSKSFESTGRAASGGTTFILRGFVTQSKLRNGLSGNITTSIDAANVESIEVLKGPSATLFGSSMGSYGGLINRVSKKPFKTRGGEVSYYAGSYGLNRLTADFNTPLDSTGKLLFRINTAYSAQNGFQENAFRKSFLFAPSISYQVSQKLSFELDAEFNQLESAGSQFLYFYGNTPVSEFVSSSAADIKINYRSSFSSSDLTKRGQNANLGQ
ncbi:TonB-dependent receptor plug domain-containing protein [Pedobacter sp.]|uniref:TonB-dependent receptor plug domain-containing protein n=1 Tax=Pedobacter sp. TaxID=1411316 RepID=UPI003C4BE265